MQLGLSIYRVYIPYILYIFFHGCIYILFLYIHVRGCMGYMGMITGLGATSWFEGSGLRGLRVVGLEASETHSTHLHAFERVIGCYMECVG